MKNIQSIEDMIEDIPEWGIGKYAKAFHLADKLKDGFAISIPRDGVADFFNTLKDITWIEQPETLDHYTNSRYYFVLFGRKLLHSDKPCFGGFELEVYTPSKF